MIVGIEGTVERKEPTFVHLNVSGIIYETPYEVFFTEFKRKSSLNSNKNRSEVY